LKTTTPHSAKRTGQHLGEHENELFAKWVSTRREKLKETPAADHSANPPGQLKRATP
jgi:hypothetical protein